MERSMAIPRVVKNTFTSSYAFEYEKLSSVKSRPYEMTAKVLSNLDGGIKAGDTVVEIGCGTGNSTIILAESNPRFGRFIALDPSIGFLNIAVYKFGEKSLTIPEGLEVDPLTLEYIEQQRQRALPFQNRVEFVYARGDNFWLPLAPLIADKIYLASGLHWLAFADDDPNQQDKEYVLAAIKDFSKVLKPGGKLFFDSSGHQFDFEDKQYNGHPVNSYHYLGHPFRLEFIKYLGEVLASKGYEFDINSVLPKPPYNRYFNLAFFKRILNDAGFEIIPTTDGRPYKLTMQPQGQTEVLAQIREAGKMQYFKTPQLSDIPESEKVDILTEALELTTASHQDLLSHPSYGLFASFAARKL